jgi:type VI secretion system secreted protein Hcp
MAFDSFLKIDGVPGESTDDKHKDWIEILSYSVGATQPASATASSAGGGGAERVTLHDMNVTKLMDKASPKLFELCATGKHIPNVTLELCRAGGDKLKYMEIKMEQVIISGFQGDGHGGADQAFPIETVTFNYGKIKQTYTQQKRADGSGGGNVAGGWDATANKVHS